jgi:hypothetical protein
LNPEQQELYKKGIPLDVIIEGDEAIMRWAQDNNVTLPQREQRQTEKRKGSKNEFYQNKFNVEKAVNADKISIYR